jgi:hypothetical protein
MEGVEEALIRFRRGREELVMSVTEEGQHNLLADGWEVEEEIMRHTRLAIRDERAQQ